MLDTRNYCGRNINISSNSYCWSLLNGFNFPFYCSLFFLLYHFFRFILFVRSFSDFFLNFPFGCIFKSLTTFFLVFLFSSRLILKMLSLIISPYIRLNFIYLLTLYVLLLLTFFSYIYFAGISVEKSDVPGHKWREKGDHRP